MKGCPHCAQPMLDTQVICKACGRDVRDAPMRSAAPVLVGCPACGHQMSSAAVACPGCGNPNAAAVQQQASAAHQQDIQRKNSGQMAGCGILLLSFVVGAVAPPVGVVMFLVGLVMMLVNTRCGM